MSNQILISSGAKLRDLDDVIIGTDGVLSSLGFNVANGVPKLDENGKILVSQLPNSVMEFKGVWNAATNTPTLVDGTGNAGDVYLCNVAGTVNFGTGPITFAVGDYAVYTGTVWARSSGATGTVTSVAVSKDGDALAITGSPITTSGTINIGFTGTNLQYINGAGNLVTFPALTGYVPYTGATSDVNLGTYGLIGDFIRFNTTPTSLPTTQGSMYWNPDEETVDVILNGVTGSLMQDSFFNVKNQTGSTIPKGTVVRANGTVGASGRILIAPFLADGTYDSKFCIGVTAEEIIDGDDGKVTAFGAIRQIDTSAFPNGTVLYASPTVAGAFTSTEPTNPNNIVTVAIVVYSDDNNGEIFVRPTFIPSENDIVNALGYTPANAATELTINGTTYDLSANRTWSVGTVTSVGLSAPTGFSVTGSPVTSSGTLALSFDSGYSLPTNVKQSNWDDAYTWVAAFPTQTGNAGKFLTTDGSSLSWATVIAGVQSVTASSPLFSSGGANPNITIQVANTSQNGYLSSTDWNTFNGKQAGSTNLTSLSGLTYASTSFVKMTAAGTFSLDTNTYTVNPVFSGANVNMPIVIQSAGSLYYTNSYINPSTNSMALAGPLYGTYANFLNSGWAANYSSANRYINIALGGTSDYIQSVILLHPIYNGTLINYNLCSGTIYQTRGSTVAGSIFNSYKIDTQSAYNGTYGSLESLNNAGQLVTCNYGGVLYLALLPHYYTSSITFTFDGFVQSSNSISLQIVEYRNSQTGAILNNEVYTSISAYSVNMSKTFSTNFTAASFIKAGGTSSQFLKADGSVDSNSYVTGGPYLPLSGGTLTGPLNGTSASFSSSVTSSGGFGAGISSLSSWATVLPMVEGLNSVGIGYYNNATIPIMYLVSNTYFNGSSWIYKTTGKYATIVTIGAYDSSSAFEVNASKTTGTAGTSASLSQLFNISQNGYITNRIEGLYTSQLTLINTYSSTQHTHIGAFAGNSYWSTNWYYNSGGAFDDNTKKSSSIVLNSDGSIDLNNNNVAGTNPTTTLKLYSTGTATFNGQLNVSSNFAVSGVSYMSNTLYYNVGDGNDWYIDGLANGPTIRMRYHGGSTNRNAALSWKDNAGNRTDILQWTDGQLTARVSQLMYDTSTVYYASSLGRSSVVGMTDGANFYITNSSAGNLYIGNYTTTYVRGALNVSSSVTAGSGFFDTSDARLKTLVEDNYLLSSIANVKAKLYIKDGRKELGYYAQDLQDILPSAINEGKDGFLTLSYSQVHTAKISLIEDEVAILKNRVIELEKQLNLN